MKLIGIGDLLIPSRYIEEGFSRYRAKGVDVEVVDWPLKDYEELQSINLQVETQGSEVYAVPDALIAKLRDAEILITQFCPITKKVIDACTKLRFIGVLRGGYENVNVPYAVQKGITVYHTPGRNATAVADFTVGMILGECRNIARAHANLRDAGFATMQMLHRYPIWRIRRSALSDWVRSDRRLPSACVALMYG